MKPDEAGPRATLQAMRSARFFFARFSFSQRTGAGEASAQSDPH